MLNAGSNYLLWWIKNTQNYNHLPAVASWCIFEQRVFLTHPHANLLNNHGATYLRRTDTPAYGLPGPQGMVAPHPACSLTHVRVPMTPFSNVSCIKVIWFSLKTCLQTGQVFEAPRRFLHHVTRQSVQNLWWQGTSLGLSITPLQIPHISRVNNCAWSTTR